HDGVAEDVAVVELDLAASIATLLVEAGGGGCKLAPRVRAGEALAGGLDSRDVRAGRDQPLRQAPEVAEGRIRQANAPIRAEHRNALGEVVERDALNPHDRVVTAFEADLLSEVLEHPGYAAVSLRVADHAQRLPVRQVPDVLKRLDRAVGRQEIFLPAAPFRLLGQLAFRAQTVEQHSVV